MQNSISEHCSNSTKLMSETQSLSYCTSQDSHHFCYSSRFFFQYICTSLHIHTHYSVPYIDGQLVCVWVMVHTKMEVWYEAEECCVAPEVASLHVHCVVVLETDLPRSPHSSLLVSVCISCAHEEWTHTVMLHTLGGRKMLRIHSTIVITSYYHHSLLE